MEEAAQVAYEDIVRKLAAERDDPTAPLFAAWFAWDDGSARLILDGVGIERVDIPSVTAKFELAMFVSASHAPVGAAAGAGKWVTRPAGSTPTAS
jgi:hypothetical protein